MTDKIERIVSIRREDLFNILENEIVFDGRHILIDNLVEIQNKIDLLYPDSQPEKKDEHEHSDGTIHSHRQGAYKHIHAVGEPVVSQPEPIPVTSEWVKKSTQPEDSLENRRCKDAKEVKKILDSISQPATDGLLLTDGDFNNPCHAEGYEAKLFPNELEVAKVQLAKVQRYYEIQIGLEHQVGFTAGVEAEKKRSGISEQSIREDERKKIGEYMERAVPETYGFNNLAFINLVANLKAGKPAGGK
jgi:hypothetical protein